MDTSDSTVRSGSAALWIGIAAAAVVVIGAVIAFVVVTVLGDGDSAANAPASDAVVDLEAEPDRAANDAAFGGAAKVGMDAVAASSAGFVAVGAEEPSTGEIAGLQISGRIWYSDNGVDWQAIDPPAVSDTDDFAIRDVIATDDAGFVAVGRDGDDGLVLRSENGRSWTSSSDDTATELALAGASLLVITRGPGGELWAGGSDNGPDLVRSTDGEHWEPVDASGLDVANGTIRDLAWDPESGFVAVGDGASSLFVWHSEDGVDWERAAGDDFFTDTEPFPAGLRGVTASDVGFVVAGAVEDAAALWHSEDGREWERVETRLGTDRSMRGTAALGDRLVAVGDLRSADGAGSRALVLVSRDGRAWEPDEFESESAAAGRMNGVGVVSNAYIAVGAAAITGTGNRAASVWVGDFEGNALGRE